MELTAEQKQQVAEWVRNGASLSDVQKQLESEFGIKMTYMDVRFLVLDLDVTPQDDDTPEAESAADLSSGGAAPSSAAADASTAGQAGGDLPGTVSVEIDRVMKPGSIVSGRVVFGDGVSATWSLDQLGRLALDAGTPDYRPSEEDVQAFQSELQKALASRGF